MAEEQRKDTVLWQMGHGLPDCMGLTSAGLLDDKTCFNGTLENRLTHQPAEYMDMKML